MKPSVCENERQRVFIAFHVPNRCCIGACTQIDVGDVSNLRSLQGAAWKVDSDIPPTQSPQTSAHKYILSVQIVSSALEATNQDVCLQILRRRGGGGRLGAWGA